jgi:large subunit ribosomal protein L16
MPLMPKRVKHRMQQKGDWTGVAQRGTGLAFGSYGLKALTHGWVKSIQIEACRVSINRYLKRRGKLWIRIFPDKPITKKPIETRMGKGKGTIDAWVCIVRPGMILLELDGVPENIAREALSLADAKLGVYSRMIVRGRAG